MPIGINVNLSNLFKQERERKLGSKLLGSLEGILQPEEIDMLKQAKATREEVYDFLKNKQVQADISYKQASMKYMIDPSSLNAPSQAPTTPPVPAPEGQPPMPESSVPQAPAPEPTPRKYIKSVGPEGVSIGVEEPEWLQKKELSKVSATEDIKKQKSMEQKAEEEQVNIQGIENMINVVWDKANELIPAQANLKEGAKKGLVRDIGTTKLARLTGAGDENAVTFRQFQEGTLSMLIRSLGEKGVLTNQDIQRAREFEPNNWDSTKQREDKRKAMKDFLQAKMKAHKMKKGSLNSDDYRTTSSGVKYKIIKRGE